MSHTSKRFQCRHIFTDGHRCGSPGLRHEEFCYYHHTTRRPAGNSPRTHEPENPFDLHLPDANDRGAIQCAIGDVLRRIASNGIDPKRAGLLLYGLQIASLNLPRAANPSRDIAQVEEIVNDPALGLLATPAVVGAEPGYRQSLTERLLAELRRGREAETEIPSGDAGPQTIDIQAHAEITSASLQPAPATREPRAAATRGLLRRKLLTATTKGDPTAVPPTTRVPPMLYPAVDGSPVQNSARISATQARQTLAAASSASLRRPALPCPLRPHHTHPLRLPLLLLVPVCLGPAGLNHHGPCLFQNKELAVNEPLNPEYPTQTPLTAHQTLATQEHFGRSA